MYTDNSWDLDSTNTFSGKIKTLKYFFTGISRILPENNIGIQLS